jgi:hypothetical protein
MLKSPVKSRAARETTKKISSIQTTNATGNIFRMLEIEGIEIDFATSTNLSGSDKKRIITRFLSTYQILTM